MVKTVLLTGASGLVGFEAFRELIKKPRYAIRLLCLGSPRERRIFRPYAQTTDIVWGDLRNQPDVERAVDGVDYIIHTAGIIPPLADENPKLAWQVNVDGTRNIIEAVRTKSNPPKIIYTSSISVYGDRVKAPYICVEDRLNPSDGDEYAKTKIRAEEIIKESGIGWSIFRLCGVLADRLNIQPLMFHMPLDTALEWCHPEDVGYALVESLKHKSIEGRVYNLGGGDKCRMLAHEFMGVMFNLWGLDLNTIPKHAFALQNFHSGYYSDGYKLNEILRFQRGTLKSYFAKTQSRVSTLKKQLIHLIPRRFIQQWLIRMSEPLKAIRENNERMIKRFYGSREAYNQLVLYGKLDSAVEQ